MSREKINRLEVLAQGHKKELLTPQEPNYLRLRNG